MPGAQCPQCGSSRTEAYDNAVTCADCGCVLEESQIVSDITFGETGSGGAVVQGSYVANDSREWRAPQRRRGAGGEQPPTQLPSLTRLIGRWCAHTGPRWIPLGRHGRVARHDHCQW